jgi:hypothetical protein
MNFSKFIVLKGHGFSRAVKSFNGFAALAAEEMQLAEKLFLRD